MSHLRFIFSMLRIQKKIYWQSENRGFGRMYREYGFYPSFLPLNICSAHGIQFLTPLQSELDHPAPVMFYFYKKHKEAFDAYQIKPCYTIICPNAFYTRQYNIKKAIYAKGTIVFPCHSTHQIDVEFDRLAYIKQLKQLPEKCFPITVCLHHFDIEKGEQKLYEEHGFNVVTAGHSDDPNFMVNFYNLLCEHNYASSNFIGSYTFYAVDIDIPFFLYGDYPVYVNNGNSDMSIGVMNNTNNDPSLIIANKLFKTDQLKITPEQKEFVEEQLGIHNSISRFKMSCILYWSFVLFVYKDLISKIKRKLK